MSDFGKILIGVALVMLVIGIAMLALGRIGFRGLPGDIRYESGNARVYFPIVSCVILSLLLTGGMWLWQWFTRR